jgi:hypothetical protein
VKRSWQQTRLFLCQRKANRCLPQNDLRKTRRHVHYGRQNCSTPIVFFPKFGVANDGSEVLENVGKKTTEHFTSIIRNTKFWKEDDRSTSLPSFATPNFTGLSSFQNLVLRMMEVKCSDHLLSKIWCCD